MWFLLPALAEPPSPARQCAEAGQGSEVEICVQLAARHPEAVDGITLALRAHIDQGSSADRDLLAALLLLVRPGSGLDGVDALDALDDPRVLPPLFEAARSEDLLVARAAVRALVRRERAREELIRWLLQPTVDLATRSAIAASLASSGDPDAVDALVDTLRQPGLPPTLSDSIEQGVRLHHPERVSELRRAISRDGTGWTSATGALVLGSALGVAGSTEGPELGRLGAVTGTLAGGSMGYLLARAFPSEAGDAAFVHSTTLAGTATGLALGAGLAPDDRQVALWSGLGGQALGFGAGLALERRHPGTVADSLEALGIGTAAALALGGAFQVGADNGLAGDRHDPGLLGAGIGLAGGTLLGHAIAPRIRLERNDWALVTLSTGAGLALGRFAPLAGNRRSLLPLVGGSTGALFGFALAGSIDPDWDALGSGGAGALFGGLVLGGTVLWIAPEERELIGGALLVGGITGMGLGGLVADIDQDPIDDRDVLLAGLTTGWVGSHVLVLNQRRHGDVFARPGPLLVIPAAGAATVSGLAPVLDVPIPHSLAGFTLGLWGTYLGATTGQLLVDDPLLPGLIGGDLGLAGAVLVLNPLVGLSPSTVAMADAGGILGGATGLVVTRLATDTPDARLIGSLAGATVGFVGGGLLGRHLRRSGQLRNIAWRLPRDLRISLVPMGPEGRPGAGIGVHGW